MRELLEAAAPHADAILATPEGRRQATEFVATNYEHIPAELLAHQLRGAAACEGFIPMIEFGERGGWNLEPERITCPVRIVWGTEDKILPWPRQPPAFARTGSRTPTGSSSTASAIARSSTCRPRPRS